MQPRLLTCLYMSEEHRNIAIWHCHKACNYRNDFGNPRNRRNWLWKQTSLQHFFTNHPICHIFLDWQWIFPYPLAGSSNSYATAHPGYQTAPPKFGPSKYQTKRSGRNTHCQRLFMYHIYIYTHIRMHRYHWFQAIFVVPFKPIRLLSRGYLHALRLAKEKPNQGTPLSDAVQFQQPLPVNCAWHPWDEDFSTNVHLDMSTTKISLWQLQICKWDVNERNKNRTNKNGQLTFLRCAWKPEGSSLAPYNEGLPSVCTSSTLMMLFSYSTCFHELSFSDSASSNVFRCNRVGSPR